jgi:hypothetical protein
MRYRHGLQLTASLAFLFVGCAQPEEQRGILRHAFVDGVEWPFFCNAEASLS